MKDFGILYLLKHRTEMIQFIFSGQEPRTTHDNFSGQSRITHFKCH